MLLGRRGGVPGRSPGWWEQVGYTSGDASMQRTRRVCSGSGVGSPVPLWTPTTCLSARRRVRCCDDGLPGLSPDGSPRFSSPRRSGSIASGTPKVSGRRRFRAPRTRHPVWRGAKSAQGDSETSSDLALPIPRTRLDPLAQERRGSPRSGSSEGRSRGRAYTRTRRRSARSSRSAVRRVLISHEEASPSLWSGPRLVFAHRRGPLVWGR